MPLERESDGRWVRGSPFGSAAAAMDMVRHRPDLYRWRRFCQPQPRPKSTFDPDRVEHWIKKVEQASQFAVTEVLYKKRSSSQNVHGPVLYLETAEQLKAHDDAYVEAQQLLSDWMNSKLKLKLASDQEDGIEDPVPQSVSPCEPPDGFQKYEKFDDFCGYLEEEAESTAVQDFVDHLLQSEIVDSGIVEDLRIEDRKEKRKPKDPRIIMELRHKQVKDKRLKRQQELELQKREKALKKFAMSEAQKQIQEEKKKKLLKTRREEEEIQKQMVVLRKEMVEKRHLMEEARKMERKQHKLNHLQKLVGVTVLPLAVPAHLDCEKEQQRKEKQTRTRELLTKIDTANRRCLRKYFSAWYKVILDRRLKMGKAKALADWKCQLKAFRAWRDYTWSQKLDQETQKMENQLRDQNRKKQLATEFNRKCILRHYFVEWQCWSHAEVQKREMQLKKEETKRRMAKFLEGMLQGKSAGDGLTNDKRSYETKDDQDQTVNKSRVNPSPRANLSSPETGRKWDLHSPQQPTWAWQVTRKHATLNAQDRAVFGNEQQNSTQHLVTPHQKVGPAFFRPFEHRHAFQKQLIEEQKRQIQEQQKLIVELKEHEKLKKTREDAERATAATLALDNPTPKISKENQLRENHSNHKSMEPLRSENHQPAAQNRRNLKMLSSPHPSLKAMEERAIRRAERRRELEEARKKREEDKLAKMQSEEEERQRQDASEREAYLEKRREERRLRKMKERDKKRRHEREQELLLKAKAHYNKVLLKKWGLEPWKRLIEKTKQNWVIAQRHHCFKLQRTCLLAWLHYVQETLSRKTEQADEFYFSSLLKKFFKGWIEYKDFASALEENANKLYDSSLKKKVLWAWFDVFNEEKSACWEKQKIADQYNDRRIMQTSFKVWKDFPAVMKEEREKEKRLDQLRKRVAEILPDFQR